MVVVLCRPGVGKFDAAIQRSTFFLPFRSPGN